PAAKPAEAPAEKPAEPSAPEAPQEGEKSAEPATQTREPAAAPEEARHARSKLSGPDEEEPETPEEIGESLHRLCASLSLRCGLSGVLAAALLGVGLIGEGLLPALPGLDPVGAPVPFMGANLL